jgi:predicted RND superfamily exporter protein
VARYIAWLLRHRALAVLAIIAALVAAVASARDLHLQFQYRDFYDYPGNAEVSLLKQDNAEFGDPAGNVLVLVEAPDVLAPAVLQYIERFTRALEPDPRFVRVLSLANARGIYAKGDDVATGPLFREIPPSPEDLDAVREYITHSPVYVHRLISPDAHATAVLAEMRTPAMFATVDQQSQAIRAVKNALAKMPPPSGIRTTVTGPPVVETEVTDALQRDQATLIPGVMLVIVLALMLTFRSVHGVVLALAAVNVALVWTAGIYALFDRHVDILASVAPTAILVYGVVDPIFVLTRFLQKVEAGLSKEEAIERAFVELAMPCFLTSLTTAVGFFTFGFATAPTVRYYGISVGIGVLLAWVTTVTVLPLLLSIVPLPKRRYSALASTRTVGAVIDWVWDRICVRPHRVIAGGVLLAVVGVVVGSSQRLSPEYVGELPAGTAKADVQRTERELSGVVRLIVYLEGAPNVMQSPAVLQAMAEVDEAMAREPLVTTTISIAEEVADVHRAFSGGDPAMHKIPNSDSLVAQYLALIDSEDKSNLINADYSRAHMAYLLVDRGGDAARELVTRLEQKLKSARFAELGVRTALTGNGIVFYQEMDKIVLDILRGFVTAFALIVLLEAIAFRSIRLAALTILPNLVPITVCFAALRIFAIPLKLDTVLVLCVSIGGLFNTTIHLVARLSQAARSEVSSLDAALHDTLLKVGPPSLYTAGILSAGFAVLGLSTFPGFQLLGCLCMLTLLTGFVSDMVFTSTLLKVFFPLPVGPGPLMRARERSFEKASQ